MPETAPEDKFAHVRSKIPPIVEQPPLRSVYVNSTRLLYGIYDFRLFLSETMANQKGEMVQVDHLTVVMAPQHMKRFVKTMIAKLADYEEKFGLIPEEAEVAEIDSTNENAELPEE